MEQCRATSLTDVESKKQVVSDMYSVVPLIYRLRTSKNQSCLQMQALQGTRGSAWVEIPGDSDQFLLPCEGTGLGPSPAGPV